jgi:aryl-alcohol dehydrogenase-like predicted oxidoreductase
MNYRTFGRLGWEVSEIGFGAWALGGGWGPQDDKDSLAALHAALDLGCNFIDTALAYGDGRSERVIAQALQDRVGQRIYIATKIPPAPGPWPPTPHDRIEDRYPAAYLRQKVEESLRNLRVERLDLLQLHTWTRAWNREPSALATLRELQSEGKIEGIGLSTPEHDQNAFNDLMRDGWLDAVQIIYNIFEQEPAAELLPLAREHGVGVIVRVVFDEGALTGKFNKDTTFAEDDFRRNYFAGDRLERTVQRVENIRATVGNREPDLATTALKFALKSPAVSTVIAGMRNADQAARNCAVSGQPPMTDALETGLRQHAWLRGFWYGGK